MCAVTHANMCLSVQAWCIFASKPVINQLFHKRLHLPPSLPSKDYVHFGKRFLRKEKHHRPLAVTVSLPLSLTGSLRSSGNR